MTKTMNSRMGWMDLLRGLAVLLVVVMHAQALPMRSDMGVEEWQTANSYLQPFRMAMLMFLSGMLLPRGLVKPLPQYLWGKWAAIGWPAFVWLFLYGLYSDALSNWEYWSSGSYLWYLLALLLCYSAALTIKPLVNRPWVFSGSCVLLAAASLCTAHFGEVIDPLLTPTVYFATFFFLGAGLRDFALSWTQAPALVVLVLAIYAAVMAHLGIEDGSLHRGTIYAATTGLSGVAVALWVAPRLYRLGPWLKPLTAVLEWAGRNSIVVYVAHFPVVTVVNRYLLGWDLSPVQHVAACTAAGLAGTLLITALRPVTAWLYVFPGRGKKNTAPKQPGSTRRESEQVSA